MLGCICWIICFKRGVQTGVQGGASTHQDSQCSLTVTISLEEMREEEILSLLQKNALHILLVILICLEGFVGYILSDRCFFCKNFTFPSSNGSCSEGGSLFGEWLSFIVVNEPFLFFCKSVSPHSLRLENKQYICQLWVWYGPMDGIIMTFDHDPLFQGLNHIFASTFITTFIRSMILRSTSVYEHVLSKYWPLTLAYFFQGQIDTYMYPYLWK